MHCFDRKGLEVGVGHTLEDLQSGDRLCTDSWDNFKFIIWKGLEDKTEKLMV